MACDVGVRDGREVHHLAARLLAGTLLVRAAATGHYRVLPADG
jgi:hypothetical protein